MVRLGRAQSIIQLALQSWRPRTIHADFSGHQVNICSIDEKFSDNIAQNQSKMKVDFFGKCAICNEKFAMCI